MFLVSVGFGLMKMKWTYSPSTEKKVKLLLGMILKPSLDDACSQEETRLSYVELDLDEVLDIEDESQRKQYILVIYLSMLSLK